MVKVLAETTGDFMITNHPDAIESHRPSVVTRDSFIDSRISLGQVKVLAEVPEHLTDADWVKKLADMKVDLKDRKKVEAAADAFSREKAPEPEKLKKLTPAEQKAADDAVLKALEAEEAAKKLAAEGNKS